MKKFLIKASSVVAILVLGILMVLPAPSAEAASFNKNKIMDDAVFDDYSTMTTPQIQSFLNQFPSSCLKNYKAPYPQSYSTYGSNVSAATVIRRAAVLWHINPRVILATLEKEESLVSGGAGCASWRYNSAMGMGCPDSGACPAPAYAGFSKQVTKGSWQLKFSKERAYGNVSWDGDGNVHYYGYMTQGYRARESGGTSSYYDGHATIDSQDVFMSNGATAALYTYTPHFHGNQNFVTIFSKWFGSTTRSILFKISGSSTYYLEWANYYYPIPSSAILQAYGLSGIAPRTIGSAPSGETQGPVLTTGVKFGSDNSSDPDYTATITMVEGGKKHNAPNWSTLNAYGISSYTAFPSSLGTVLKSGDLLTTVARNQSGSIFSIQSNKKRGFPDWTTYSTLSGPDYTGTTKVYSQQKHTNMSTAFLNRISDGAPMLLDGRFIKSSNNATIYLYDNGKKRPFSPSAYSAWGKKLDYKLSPTAVNQVPNGPAVPILVSSSSGSKYLSDGGKKKAFSASTQTAWGLSDGQFTQMTNGALARLQNDTISNLITPGAGVYYVAGGQRHGIANSIDFNKLGFSWSNVDRVGANALSLLPQGPTLYAPGSLVRTPNGAVRIINSNYTALGITSGSLFRGRFGFSWNNVRNISDTALNGYSFDVLHTLLKNSADNKYYEVDKGVKHYVDANTFSSSQYDMTAWLVSIVDPGVISSVKSGSQLTRFVRGSSTTVYYIENGHKRGITSSSKFHDLGGTWDQVTSVSDDFLSEIPTGTNI